MIQFDSEARPILNARETALVFHLRRDEGGLTDPRALQIARKNAVSRGGGGVKPGSLNHPEFERAALPTIKARERCNVGELMEFITGNAAHVIRIRHAFPQAEAESRGIARMPDQWNGQ